MGVIGPIVHSGLGTGRALAMHLSLRIIARARDPLTPSPRLPPDRPGGGVDSRTRIPQAGRTHVSASSVEHAIAA